MNSINLMRPANRETFFTGFRSEHRIIRDLYLDLITAIIREDKKSAMKLLRKLDILAGPHFRYEEEALYPSLRVFYGDSYIDKLYSDHDLIIARSLMLMEMLDEDITSKGQQTRAINLVRSQLPHVSDCEGLSIMAEKLGNEEIIRIMDCRNNALIENMDLSKWALSVRERKLLRLN